MDDRIAALVLFVAGLGLFTLLHHLARDGLTRNERAAQIDAQRRIEMGLVELEERSDFAVIRVVDHAVDTPVGLNAMGEKITHVEPVGDVAVVEDRAAAEVLDVVHQACGTTLIDVAEHEPRPEAHQPARAGTPDAIGGAHDDNCLSVEAHALRPP